MRDTVSARVAAAEIFREKSNAEAEPEYVLASGAVLLLGPVWRGTVLCDTLSSVEERKWFSSYIVKESDFDMLRKWYFPLDADGARDCDKSEDGARGWPPFGTCRQKKAVRQVGKTQKLLFYLEGAGSRRSSGGHDKRKARTSRRVDQWAAKWARWARDLQRRSR